MAWRRGWPASWGDRRQLDLDRVARVDAVMGNVAAGNHAADRRTARGERNLARGVVRDGDALNASARWAVAHGGSHAIDLRDVERLVIRESADSDAGHRQDIDVSDIVRSGWQRPGLSRQPWRSIRG